MIYIGKKRRTLYNPPILTYIHVYYIQVQKGAAQRSAVPSVYPVLWENIKPPPVCLTAYYALRDIDATPP